MSTAGFKVITRRAALLLLCWSVFLLFPALAGPEAESPPGRKHMANWKELRDKNVVRQQFDYSCGSGALATLMRLSFGDQVSEKEIITLILERKSPEEKKDIEKNGYSLLDLKQAAEKMGYATAMYKLQLSHLRQLKGPVLIYIEHHGLKHFAVFKGVKGDRVYLADPARGNTQMSIYRFEPEWPGYILAIDKK